jgi:hypothetical protein
MNERSGISASIKESKGRLSTFSDIRSIPEKSIINVLLLFSVKLIILPLRNKKAVIVVRNK